MKPFNSSIAEQLDAYVAYRRDLGFTDKHLRAMLRPFDRFVEQTGITLQQVSPLDFMDFKKSLTQEPRSVNAIIIATRINGGRSQLVNLSDRIHRIFSISCLHSQFPASGP